MKTQRMPASPERPFRVVICGEVGAGKSSVLNAIMRQSLLQPNLGTDSRPVFVVRSGDPAGLRIAYGDGRREHRKPVDLPQDFRGITQIEVQMPIAHLVGVELIEVPFTTAEEITQVQRDLVRSADLLLWVTIASQAWRLTERNIIEALVDWLPAEAVLAVSRADKLRSAADRNKIMGRLQRETSGWFTNQAFFGAAHREVERSRKSKEAWVGTGGAGLMDLILRLRKSPTKVKANVKTKLKATVEHASKLDAQTNYSVEEQVAHPQDSVLILRQSDLEPETTAIDSEVQFDEMPIETISRLQAVAADLIGATAIGVYSTGKADTCNAIVGEEATCRRVGLASRAAFDVLSRAFDPSNDAGAVSACLLSMASHRLIFQDVEGVGLIFLYADNQKLNLGALQAGMSRLFRACQVSAIADAA